MKKLVFFCCCVLFSVLLPLFSQEVNEQDLTVLEKINALKGPGTFPIGDISEITISDGYFITDGNGSRILLELMENQVSNQELALIGADDSNWFAIFEFDPVGYVPDTEKDSLDADAMLESIKKATEEANIERRKRGWNDLHITGWWEKPHYDSKTHNLEWGTICRSKEGESVNYNIRVLGRKGVMIITLVGDQKQFTSFLPIFKNILKSFHFTEGNKYAEYKKGDKIAEYGLTALIVGGGAALAAKSGLLKILWKWLVGVGIFIAGVFKKIFGGGKQKDSEIISDNETEDI